MNVWVKVVGFSLEEQHAIQTLLRLSEGECIRFKLWQPGDMLAPNVLIIDADSHAAELEIQSSTFNAQTKSIVVGHGIVIEGAWRIFERPLVWADVLRELEALFVATDVDIDLHGPEDAQVDTHLSVPPGYKTGLIVGLAREEQLYLKARLSLQGITHVDEVDTAGDAAQRMGQQTFDVVVLSQDLPDADLGPFIQALRERGDSKMAVVAVLRNSNWQQLSALEALGTKGVLEIPFVPHQVGALFSRL